MKIGTNRRPDCILRQIGDSCCCGFQKPVLSDGPRSQHRKLFRRQLAAASHPVIEIATGRCRSLHPTRGPLPRCVYRFRHSRLNMINRAMAAFHPIISHDGVAPSQPKAALPFPKRPKQDPNCGPAERSFRSKDCAATICIAPFAHSFSQSLRDIQYLMEP